MKKINPKYILVATAILSCYFLLLFLNVSYGFVESNSFMAAIPELLTIPLTLLACVIAVYCIIRLKEKNTTIFISLALSLAVIIAMFLIK